MRRFDFALGQTGLVLAVASAASATSSLLAPRLSRRFGLVETMVFTHLPANVLCIAAGLAPNAPVAVTLLVLRALLSQLDVPARQTFVMSVVPPEERAAAAAFTNLPRSLAAAATPPIAGWLLHHSTVGWPLVAGGGLKVVYDLLLLARFRRYSTKA
jgi:MFS family permease